MSIIDIYLDTNLYIFKAKGYYRQQYNDDSQIEIILKEVYCKNGDIDEAIIKEFKNAVEKIIKDYTEDLNFYGNITGNLENYITDNEILDEFYSRLSKLDYTGDGE